MFQTTCTSTSCDLKLWNSRHVAELGFRVLSLFTSISARDLLEWLQVVIAACQWLRFQWFLITEADTARPPPGWSLASVNKHIQLLFHSILLIACALGVWRISVSMCPAAWMAQSNKTLRTYVGHQWTKLWQETFYWQYMCAETLHLHSLVWLMNTCHLWLVILMNHSKWFTEAESFRIHSK